jgi:sulfur dioxygenase
VKTLAQSYASCLYLCTDSTEDLGAPAGFADIQTAFKEAQHIPFAPSAASFQPGATYFDCQDAYSSFERALDRLPRPTVIVCKSARRAGAVLTAYKGAKEGGGAEKAMSFAKDQGLSFVGAAGLAAWVQTVAAKASSGAPILFRQMFEPVSSTYTYLLADELTREAVLIDPVVETAARDAKIIKELGLSLKYSLNTHVHADHVTGSWELKTKHFPDSKSCIAAVTGAVADVQLREGDTVAFGSRFLRVLSTPGHTDGCLSFVLDDDSRVFTGDALLIRMCGRTDFQQGSPATLFSSVRDKLFKLPDACTVYPAHDYSGLTSSSIGEEKASNPRLALDKTFEAFNDIMNQPRPLPAQIDVAVPANMRCGEPIEEVK